ncbi:MAG: N-acetylgalactosamine 6-sulfate sulfatase, partial [Verrucomicrobia bacterium]|nr:N-acetylgalactosamine 6-sulfate sulfatase [Verrucomicrobiota bacterium]
VVFELYNLETHPMEDKDLSGNPEQAERLKLMKQELAKWQLSVMRSLNGKDYK